MPRNERLGRPKQSSRDFGRNSLYFESLEKRCLLTGTPELIDLNVEPFSSNPAEIVEFQDEVHFVANDNQIWKIAATGDFSKIQDHSPLASPTPRQLTEFDGQLFYVLGSLNVTDGSLDGAVRLTNRGRTGELEVAGDTLFFVDNLFEVGTELFKTDGTVEGTEVVKDIWDGPQSSVPSKLTGVGNLLFFEARDDVNGKQLWRSDGSEAGTFIVKNNIAGSGDVILSQLTPAEDKLFFISYDRINDRNALWVSDGTEAGTIQVSGEELLSFGQLVSLGNQVVFSASSADAGSELWITDGTIAGTQRIEDLVPGTDSSSPDELRSLGDQVGFIAETVQDEFAVWVTDGQLNTAMPIGFSLSTSMGRIVDIASAGETIYVTWREASGEFRLWSNSIEGSSNDMYSHLELEAAPTVIEGELYFSANDGITGFELWKTDGSVSGTKLVADTAPGNSGSVLRFLAEYENEFLFVNDADGNTGNVSELWKSDGTELGTEVVSELRGFTGLPTLRLQSNDILYFTDANGMLFRTDGRAEGTYQLGFRVYDLFEYDNTVYFEGLFPERGLYKTDGTRFNSELVFANGESLGGSVVHQGELYLTFGGLFSGYGLYKSDGTAEGTVHIRNFDSAGQLTSWRDLVYFAAEGDSNGEELWVTDGTLAGTNRLTDINPISGDSAPRTLFPVGDVIYFAADDGEYGRELWRTDGTLAGTFMMADVNPNTASSFPQYFHVLGEQVVFAADHDIHGREFWRTDGTEQGTTLLKDINSLEANAFVTLRAHVHDDIMYFRATTEDEGEELWITDGTVPGTQLFLDINPGEADSRVDGMTVVGDRLYFFADDGLYGKELWTLGLDSSADFDTDGDVDGADFLHWQRGYGHSHDLNDLSEWQFQFGNSFQLSDYDTDGDSDGADFLNWQRGFGTFYDANDLQRWQDNFANTDQLTSTVGIEQLVSVFSDATPLSKDVAASATNTIDQLVDIAIAWELLHEPVENESIALVETNSREQTVREQVWAAVELKATVSMDVEGALVKREQPADSDDDFWLKDKLLNRLFS